MTNKTWADFWLNEASVSLMFVFILSQGFTVFLERKITGRMHGEAAAHFSGLLLQNVHD